jgi:hypothetical protein
MSVLGRSRTVSDRYVGWEEEEEQTAFVRRA